MEVHHHPNVEKKRFREYILEFLMIFLAVTMGFFAESLRENISNKDKEKEYINSFVQNLQIVEYGSTLLHRSEESVSIKPAPGYPLLSQMTDAFCPPKARVGGIDGKKGGHALPIC